MKTRILIQRHCGVVSASWVMLSLIFLLMATAAQSDQSGDFSYEQTGSAITITKYTGADGAVSIPSTINGLPVTSIGDWAFYDCTNLTSITISNGVGSIGDATFFGCGRLANIRIPNTVTNIGDAAFFGCGSLTRTTIPENVTSIGGYAFYGCSNLRSVYFHGNAPSIGSDVFSGDNNVTVYYQHDSTGWDSTFGGRLSAPWPFDYTTNNGTITIARYTGSGGDVSIPDTIDGMPVTSIGHGAFYGCCGLTNITIPNSVTSIGGGTYGTHYGREGAFAGCTNLTSVTIGNGVTSIGNFAFFRCTALTSITIPNSVTSIGYGAFSGSSNLIGVTISDSLSNIEDFAFSDCTSLTNITIPTSVTSIGRYSLGGCTSLTSITIPYSVTNIAAFVDEYGEHGAFLGCANLREITVDTRNSFYSSVDGVLFSKSQTTLVQCPEAKSGNYTIPNGVIRIGDGAFSGCARLASVIIANSVTNIGYWAFSDCTNLTSITLPDSITRIGAFAFSGCINLIRVNFQGNVPNFASYLPFNYNGPPIFDVFGNNVTVYYLPKTTGWGTTLVYGYWMDDINGPPTMLWKPQMQARNASFGVGSNQFGFNINWASGQVVVVETCTNLTNPVWYPIQTNTLTGDSSYFSDPQWTNYPTRFYRLRPL